MVATVGWSLGESVRATSSKGLSIKDAGEFAAYFFLVSYAHTGSQDIYFIFGDLNWER